MSYKLKLLKHKISKELKALDEDFKLEDYINPKLNEIKVNTDPYEYVVLDNFFKEGFYKEICSFFDSVFEKGFAKENNNERFHPFLDVAYPYDGYVKSIYPFENKVSDILISSIYF
jgi:hypothetical protein